MARNALRRETYALHDPFDDEAIGLIRTIFATYGLRPVCLYTDRKARFYGERLHPVLRTDLVEDALVIDGLDTEAVARWLGERYDVRCVLPWSEQHVGPAADLCDLLGVDWNDRDVVLRFRDKHELKRYVAEVDPGVRVPANRLVRGPADLAGDLPPRFVVKPNDGYGNRGIGIFDDDQVDAAREHVGCEPDTTWILEEFVGGTEYHIDGQVREAGEVVPLAVFEYVRSEVNGYQTVYVGELQCTTTDPVFDELVDYAKRLLTATGLRRCPFHLEVKLDERGPCVVDLGARFPSDGGVDALGRLHPYRPEPLAIAASDYLGGSLYADDVVDWTHHDRTREVFAYGISDRGGLIAEIDGLAAVEAMPEFTMWTHKPQIGDRISPTRELRDMTFLAQLTGTGSRADALQLLDTVRSMIDIKVAEDRRTKLAAAGRNLSRRVRPKMRWINHRVGHLGRRGAERAATVIASRPPDSPGDVEDLCDLAAPARRRTGSTG